ncbi:MAG: hypothetical protein AAFX81_04525 [Pseudomonadota bacterium]
MTAVTTGMLGEGFYDRHSAPQWAAIEAVLPWLEDAIATMDLPEPPATLGAYAGRGELFDVGVMLVMGVLGYMLATLRYPLSAVVLGLVLGPLAERYFVQTVEMVNWDLSVFVTRPICIALWVGIASSLVASRVLARRARGAQ